MDTAGMTIWVCQCCMLTHANGECCEHDRRDPKEPMPWALWALRDDATSISMGLFSEQHSQDCEFNRSEGAADCDQECETRSYSTSRCDGCGSYLHGERYAFTPWYTDPD